MKEEKKLNLPQSLLLLVLIIFSVAVCIRLKTGGPMIGLFASWIFIYLVCKIVRIPYDNVVAGAYDAIRIVVVWEVCYSTLPSSVLLLVWAVCLKNSAY